MFAGFADLLRGAWWVYPLVAAVSGGDVLFPVIPSDTVVIIGGVIAGQGELILVLIIVMAALGAFLGDNAAYWIGRRGRAPVRNRLLRGERGRRSLEWAEDTLRRHGGTFIVAGRYVPGGRTATTVAAGIADYPWARFALFDALGATTWATYTTLAGYIGGQAFQQRFLLGLALSLSLCATVAAIIEIAPWIHRRAKTRAGRQHGR